MKIKVCIKDRQIEVQCGQGGQPLRWLCNVGLSRYNSTEGISLGRPLGLRTQDKKLPWNGIISEHVQDSEQVFLVFPGQQPQERKAAPASSSS
jgi:hypothetical protein